MYPTFSYLVRIISCNRLCTVNCIMITLFCNYYWPIMVYIVVLIAIGLINFGSFRITMYNLLMVLLQCCTTSVLYVVWLLVVFLEHSMESSMMCSSQTFFPFTLSFFKVGMILILVSFMVFKMIRFSMKEVVRIFLCCFTMFHVLDVIFFLARQPGSGTKIW